MKYISPSQLKQQLARRYLQNRAYKHIYNTLDSANFEITFPNRGLYIKEMREEHLI